MNKAKDIWHATLPSQLIGFERFLNRVNSYHNTVQSYPPYNVIKNDDNSWSVEIAIAGFDEDEVEVTEHNGVLSIRGNPKDSEYEEGQQILHKGISSRKFDLRFDLAEHVYIVDANVNNGLLSVNLGREVPEELQPKKIEVKFK